MKALVNPIMAAVLMSTVARAPEAETGSADADQLNIQTGEDRAEPEAATAAEAAPAKSMGRFSPEQISEIRTMRAERSEETGRPAWSHAKLAERFETTAGVISQIVRNRTYKDPNYTPTNDGK